MSKFSYNRIFVVGLGFFTISIAWQIYNAFMPLMLGEFIESKALRGMIMGLDNFANLLLIPIIGAWSDRLHTSYGKRLPFLMVGMPLAAIFLFLMPNYHNLWTLIAIDIGFLLAMTLFRAPTVSLMPDITPSEKRSQANGIINFMGGVGALVALFGLAQIHKQNEALPFYIVAVIMLLVIITFVLVLKRIVPVTSDKGDEGTSSGGLIQGLREIFTSQDRSIIYLLLAIFFWFLGYSGVEAQFTTYGVESLGLLEGDAATLLGVFSLTFIIFAIPSGFLARFWGRKRTIQIGILGLSIVFVILFFVSNILLMQIFLLVGGMCWALINIHSYPMVVDMTTETKIGLYTGIYYLFSSLSQMAGPFLVGLFMDLLGNQFMFISSMLLMLISFFFISGVRIVHKNGKMAQTNENVERTI